MGYDLSNAAGSYLRFSGSGWSLALALAQHYGWQPAGTLKPPSWGDDDGPWEGDYWHNAGQQVVPDDASALADALDRAIGAADSIESAQRVAGGLNEALVERYPKARGDTEPLTRLDAEKFRERLRELAALARQGAFVIE